MSDDPARTVVTVTVSLGTSAVVVSNNFCSTACYDTPYVVCMHGLKLTFALQLAMAYLCRPSDSSMHHVGVKQKLA